jgi:hypothetical protein
MLSFHTLDEGTTLPLWGQHGVAPLKFPMKNITFSGYLITYKWFFNDDNDFITKTK